MKKSLVILAAAAMLLGTACSSGQKADNGADSTAVEQTEEDIVAGANPQAEGETPANLINLQDDDMEQLKAAEGQVLAIDFGATWCIPCKEFHPTFDEAAAKYPDVKFVYVDIDDNEQVKDAYNIESVPTVIVIDAKGNEKRYTGGTADLLPSEKFFNIIEEASK